MDYIKEVSGFCDHYRQGAMKGQLKSLYHNIVWVFEKTPEMIKLIGVSWSIRGTNEQIESLSFMWLG